MPIVKREHGWLKTKPHEVAYPSEFPVGISSKKFVSHRMNLLRRECRTLQQTIQVILQESGRTYQILSFPLSLVSSVIVRDEDIPGVPHHEQHSCLRDRARICGSH